MLKPVSWNRVRDSELVGMTLIEVVLGIVLLCLLVWFVGPLIAIAGFQPLLDPTVRLAAILVIVLIWGIRNLWAAVKAKKTNSQVVAELSEAPAVDEAAVESPEEVAVLRERFQEALSTLKQAYEGQRTDARPSELVAVVMNLGQLYGYLEEPDSARFYLGEAEALAKRSERSDDLLKVRLSRAWLELENENLSEQTENK